MLSKVIGLEVLGFLICRKNSDDADLITFLGIVFREFIFLVQDKFDPLGSAVSSGVVSAGVSAVNMTDIMLFYFTVIY